MNAHHTLLAISALLATTALACQSSTTPTESKSATTSNLDDSEEETTGANEDNGTTDDMAAPNAGRSQDFAELTGCATDLGTFREGACYGASTCRNGTWVHDWCEK